MKIALYLALIFPLLMSSQNITVGDTLSPSVSYHNLKDTVIPSIGTRVCDLDLDADNVKDVRFRIVQTSSPGHVFVNQSVQTLNGFEFAAITNSLSLLDTMPVNGIIDRSLHWHTTTDSVVLFNHFYTAGNTTFFGLFLRNNAYIGFRKIAANDTLYGWILVDAGLSSGLKIRSWAYENSTAAGIFESTIQKKLSVYPNPSSGILYIQNPNNTT